ncbi:hypothetical protein K1T71_009808 [Dendrolimus kikuchii]|uniref:Uncharacterized protein n=1 Tax=Dendrolimus kikuchii TaxID=765133 RepID=A0ACC1CT48_9NEOP|nr:hypothetical protein K1T71_009808 [Dendrolimus kikuchii]
MRVICTYQTELNTVIKCLMCVTGQNNNFGDGRWRQVIRRCASVAETGVTGVCNWGVYDNGVYWEECYCSSDECNSSTFIFPSYRLLTIGLLLYLCNIW